MRWCDDKNIRLSLGQQVDHFIQCPLVAYAAKLSLQAPNLRENSVLENQWQLQAYSKSSGE